MRKLAIVATTLALLAGSAMAQTDYPAQPITMIVPFAAGGPTDTVARLIAEPMTRTLGQQVIVENVAGAGGTLAAGREAKADPDGYTLLVHHIGLASSVGLYRKLTYDAATAFAPIGRITDVPMTVVGKADLQPGLGRRAARLHPGQRGGGRLRPRRRGCGLAPVRPPLDGRPGHEDDRGGLQGQRAGDDRPARRPGGHDLRPDHEHGRAISRAARSRPMP